MPLLLLPLLLLPLLLLPLPLPRNDCSRPLPLLLLPLLLLPLLLLPLLLFIGCRTQDATICMPPHSRATLSFAA